ncbi:hypothetical protein [Moorena sp. SIO3H5]|uniref:hypothetical protein n=1 Tax=Moorena sp. SIO3H5 TaxID=2607834 RepID=UPI0013B7B206|nr:hypothetical protein [Moorena sp. SIO3H5]NEO70657.1 hypothetical protein [Moorena sp. SIO3H5]
MQRIAILYSLFPSWEGLGVGSCSRLDAVAHGGNPQDRAASLFPDPLFPKI